MQLVSADAEHVETLRRGPRYWNAWREQNPTIMPNLTGVRLSASERQMGVMNGGPINLASARMRRAQLRFATLTGANLAGANLAGADLTDARLDRANLANADLSEALLDHTDFAEANLAGANLRGANLLKARNLTEAQLDEAFGDEATILPPQLKAPEHWMAPAVEPVRVERPRAVTRIAPRTRSDRTNTVSWLVGGPLQTA